MRTLEISTIFLGAFLLFLVQPMMGNTLLPVFGGTASVWSVCLATFQILLVGGYFYAHFAMGMRKRMTLPVHCGLLFLSSFWLMFASRCRHGIADFASGIPSALGTFCIIIFLAAVPYVIFSSNSSLVQELSGGRYRLYAVSNLGSLVGLWAYPLVFERYFTLTAQWTAFAWLSFAYASLFTIMASAGRRIRVAAQEKGWFGDIEEAADAKPMKYFTLSALSCFLLNAVSIHLGTDVTPLPFIWVLLLSLYLLSYIVAFTNRGSSFSVYAGYVLVPIALFAAWHVGFAEFRHFRVEFATSAMVLFLGGLAIHSMLYRSRPSREHLTMFYLMIALGGAFGGSLCSFGMPMVSNKIVEYPIAVALAAGVAAFPFVGRRHVWVIVVAVCAIAMVGVARVGSAEGSILKRYRNFYGAGCVAHRTIEVSRGNPYEANEFKNSGTTHGLQVTDGDRLSLTPTVYYAAHAGGLPLLSHHKAVEREPMRVALCGMGIGTLATYAREGDLYRFYEINPAVAEIAKDKTLFSFISSAKGDVDVVVDDARRAMERERAANEPKYDIIVVDVFTGDAIPPHMATEEAFRLYLDRLEPDGILAFHLSNWHLDLMPMIKAAKDRFGLHTEAYYCASTPYAFDSIWALMSLEELPKMYDSRCHEKVDFGLVPDVALMTDEKHSLLPYVHWLIK